MRRQYFYVCNTALQRVVVQERDSAERESPGERDKTERQEKTERVPERMPERRIKIINDQSM